jgi:guanidinopropionase
MAVRTLAYDLQRNRSNLSQLSIETGLRRVSTERYIRPDIAGENAYDPMKEPRYTEIATFMRAPLATTLESVDIGLIGVPTDLGVTNRPGARHGPREIRNASSLMRAFNLGLGVNPYELCRIADLGDVRLSHRYDLEKQNDDIEAFYRKVKAAGVIPISAGGDHSITYPIFRAIAATAPIGMVHIDAHTDTWGEFFGSKFTHGAPFRLAVEAGVAAARTSWMASSSPDRTACAWCSLRSSPHWALIASSQRRVPWSAMDRRTFHLT